MARSSGNILKKKRTSRTAWALLTGSTWRFKHHKTAGVSRQNHLSLYPAQFLYLSVSLFLLLISATRQPEHSLTADGLLIYLSRHYTYILFHRTPHIHSLTHSCSRDRPECSVIQSSSISTTFAESITYQLYRLNSHFLNSSINCTILSNF